MNPLQKVPVLKDGDFTLTESVAMFRYLAREKGVEDHWYPRDTRAQVMITVHMYGTLYIKPVLYSRPGWTSTSSGSTSGPE